MTIGERIRKRREELGLSQEELAVKMGYSGKSTVCKAETCGDNVTTSKVRRFADALGCSYWHLMGSELSEADIIDIHKCDEAEGLPFADESAVLKAYREASEEIKAAVRAVLGVKS